MSWVFAIVAVLAAAISIYCAFSSWRSGRGSDRDDR